MSFGLSNLAWPVEADPAVATVLAEAGIDSIDLAPSRYFAAAASLDPARIEAVGAFWRDHGITIVGLQSLLFDAAFAGEAPPALFGDAASIRAFDRILEQRIGLAAALGARVLVFGSWPNRRRGAVEADRALDLAVRRFGRLAVIAADAGVVLTIEPIFAGYGNDFIIDHHEAAALVAAVDHPGFGLTLDIGCAGLVDEAPDLVLDHYGSCIRHVQLAEPGLAVLTDSAWHAHAGPILARWLADRRLAGLAVPGVCIEALPPAGVDPVIGVRRSIAVGRRWYS